MSDYLITTTDRTQREKWLDLFGVDVLPVRDPYPAEKMVRGRGLVFFYTLDPGRMQPRQLHRLAAHITAQVWGTDYVRVLSRISSEGYDIDATHCRLLETAESKRPSLSVWRRFRRLGQARLAV